MTQPSSGPRAEQAIASERQLLGAILYIASTQATNPGIDRKAVETARALVAPEHFYLPKHAAVFQAMLDLAENNQPVEAMSVYGRAVASARDLIPLDLADMQQQANGGVEVIEYHGGAIREYWLSRALDEQGQRLAQSSRNPEAVPAEVLDAHIERITALQDAALTKSKILYADEMLTDAITRIEDVEKGNVADRKWVLHSSDLNTAYNGGFRAGQFIVVAGRPGTGKTTFVVDLVRTIAVGAQGKPVLLISLEMSAEQMMYRLLSAMAEIDYQRLIAADLRDADWRALSGKYAAILESKFAVVEENSSVTMADIRRYAREVERKYGEPPLVIVDYIQLMRSTGRVESRQIEVAGLSSGFKMLAKDLGVPVIGLAQLNRGPESRSDKRPMTSDLRESGALEQDSDSVILLHRPEMYHTPSMFDPDEVGKMVFIIGKNREGKAGIDVHLVFQGQYCRTLDPADAPAANGWQRAGIAA